MSLAIGGEHIQNRGAHGFSCFGIFKDSKTSTAYKAWCKYIVRISMSWAVIGELLQA